MPKGYIPSNTSVHFINYHFVWCPKYRRKVLNEPIRKRLEELIREKIKKINCEILSLSISEDHIHLFVQANPKLSANYVVGQVKGYTSNVLRKEFQELRSKLPTLWTRSYFVSTHGHISDDMIKKYIEEQKGM